MMTITERIAYIRGIADTLELDSSDKKDRLILAMIDVLGDIAVEVDEINDELAEMNNLIDEIDEDLGAVEEEVYDLDGCDCCCDDDCDCDCDCCDDDCDCCCDDDCVEAVCPNCGADICIDFEELEEGKSIVCPACDTKLEFELVDDDELDEEE